MKGIENQLEETNEDSVTQMKVDMMQRALALPPGVYKQVRESRVLSELLADLWTDGFKHGLKTALLEVERMGMGE